MSRQQEHHKAETLGSNLLVDYCMFCSSWIRSSLVLCAITTLFDERFAFSSRRIFLACIIVPVFYVSSVSFLCRSVSISLLFLMAEVTSARAVTTMFESCGIKYVDTNETSLKLVNAWFTADLWKK